jgi:hypothetical protein
MSAIENGYASLGVPKHQIDAIKEHITSANSHVYSADLGPDEAITWLNKSLKLALEPKVASHILGLANCHKPTKVEYLEEGFDSNQSHKHLSKVVSELILLGGVAYEYELLGLPFDTTQETDNIASGNDLSASDLLMLSNVAKVYGAKQDFLFPGVVPSCADTPGLHEYAQMCLAGTPMTTVRTVHGLGGLRSDVDWNYVVDLPSFASLKVSDDKRYYPGLGVFDALQKHHIDDIPAVCGIKTSNPAVN